MKTTKTKQATFVFEFTVITNKNELLDKYSKFESLEDFNRDYAKAMKDVRHLFTELQRDVLFLITQHAANAIGVANASYRTYMERFEKQFGYTVSEDTIRRAINKAQKQGLLLKLKSRRERNTSQTANVIIFNPYEEVVAYRAAAEAKHKEELEKRAVEEYEASKELIEWGKKAKEIAKKNIVEKNQKELLKELEEAEEKAPKTDFQKLHKLVSAYYGDNKGLTYKLYGIWLAQTKQMILKPDFELALRAFKLTIRALKDGKIRILRDREPNIKGYFNGVLTKMINNWLEEESERALNYPKFSEEKQFYAVVEEEDSVLATWLEGMEEEEQQPEYESSLNW